MKKIAKFAIGICVMSGLLLGKGFAAEAEETQMERSLRVVFENHPEYEADFKVYQAAKPENGKYVLKDSFAELEGRIDFNKDFDSPEKLNQMEIRELKEIIQELSGQVMKKGIKPDAEFSVKGEAVQRIAEDGIYLVIPVENDSLEIEPFLTQIPAWEEETRGDLISYVQKGEVEVHPKAVPKEEETETSETETPEMEPPGTEPPEEETTPHEGGIKPPEESSPGTEPLTERAEAEERLLDRIGTGDEAGRKAAGYAALAAAMLVIILYGVRKRSRKGEEED